MTENRIIVREASRRSRIRRGGTMAPKWFRGQAVGRLRRAKGACKTGEHPLVQRRDLLDEVASVACPRP